MFVALLRELYKQKQQSNTAGKDTRTEMQKAVVHYGVNFLHILLIAFFYQMLIGLPFIGDTKLLENYFLNQIEEQNQRQMIELEEQVSQLERDSKSEVVTQRKRIVDDLQ